MAESDAAPTWACRSAPKSALTRSAEAWATPSDTVDTRGRATEPAARPTAATAGPAAGATAPGPDSARGTTAASPDDPTVTFSS
ncbi:hypothetical protein ACWEQ3_51480, partial [Streptomyces mirabilis]